MRKAYNKTPRGTRESINTDRSSFRELAPRLPLAFAMATLLASVSPATAKRLTKPGSTAAEKSVYAEF